MADPRRRYLAQQAEIGGSEVVLPAGPGVAGGAWRDAVGPLRETTDAAPAHPETRNPQPETRNPHPPDRWLKGAPPIPGPGLSVEPPAPTLLAGDPLADLATLDAVARLVSGCTRCPLCKGRTNTVPGEGDPGARLVCVGEGPGQNEDRLGRPFVGRAGDLLNEILAAIGLPRETVYICNVVKCRPPQNRTPLPDEMDACLPYLHRQLALIRPKVILALGATAATALLGARRSLADLRNQVHTYGGIPLIATYHPAALLRNPNWKKPTWDDVRIARQLLDR